MLPGLPVSARVAHVFYDLKSKYLIYIGQLCDPDYTDEFTKTKVFIRQDGNIILRGMRSPTLGGMWHIHLPTISPAWTPLPSACENLMIDELWDIYTEQQFNGHATNSVYDCTTQK